MIALPLAMRLRAARKARGMTVREAADAIGVSRSYYHAVEMGSRAPTDESKFEAFMAWRGEAMPG